MKLSRKVPYVVGLGEPEHGGVRLRRRGRLACESAREGTGGAVLPVSDPNLPRPGCAQTRRGRRRGAGWSEARWSEASATNIDSPMMARRRIRRRQGGAGSCFTGTSPILAVRERVGGLKPVAVVVCRAGDDLDRPPLHPDTLLGVFPSVCGRGRGGVGGVDAGNGRGIRGVRGRPRLRDGGGRESAHREGSGRPQRGRRRSRRRRWAVSAAAVRMMLVVARRGGEGVDRGLGLGQATRSHRCRGRRGRLDRRQQILARGAPAGWRGHGLWSPWAPPDWTHWDISFPSRKDGPVWGLAGGRLSEGETTQGTGTTQTPR